MKPVFVTRQLGKRFGATVALDHVDVDLTPSSIVGLVGRNGGGKTTLLRHVVGLYLPSEGSAETFGVPCGQLGHAELSRIGFVPQENRLLEWMTVAQHLRYVASFYTTWDEDREARLRRELELEPDTLVGALSSGNLQKLVIVLAVCHHPELLILDEPASDLDPIARAAFLEFLLEVVREDGATVVVSSHVLRDVERIVDWVVCLDRGRVTADAALDELKESHAEWLVTAPEGRLPNRFIEPYVLRQTVDGRRASLLVRPEPGDLESFLATYSCAVDSRPLNLDELFPLLVEERP